MMGCLRLKTIELVVAVVTIWVSSQCSLATDNWPQFRGNRASGIDEGQPPISWNIETGDNIRWTTAIPGLAHSSPIIWNDRVYLTTAISTSTDQPTLQTGWLGGTGKSAGDQGDWIWAVLCLDRTSGEILWRKEVAKGQPKLKRHLKATHADCTPATDGEHIVAFFGSEGLYCLDNTGNILWKKDFGKLHSGPYNAPELEWGFSSSPIIYRDKVIVQCDCLNTGFVGVFELATGKQILRIERNDVATWATPNVVEHRGTTQLVCNGYKQMAGYDLSTGKTLWTLGGGGDVPVPTPLFANGKILLTNGHGRSPTYAINPEARGDLTPSTDSEQIPAGLAWWQPKDGAYMPTPIIVGAFLYTCNDNGRLVVRRMDNGSVVYKKRVASENFSASAVATPERVYFAAENGKVFVVKTGDQYERLAVNDMGDVTMATPALSNNELFVRTRKQLVCIGRTD